MPKKKQVVEETPLPETQVIEQTLNETVLDVPLPESTPHETPPSAVVEVLSTLPTEEVKETKVKPKRKAQPKKIEVKEIIEVKEPEQTQEEPKEKKKVKTLEQVQCNTCEKEMTKRTLRYHHKCPGEVKKTEELPVKKRVKKEVKKEDEKKVLKQDIEQPIPIKEPLPDTCQARLQEALAKRIQTV